MATVEKWRVKSGTITRRGGNGSKRRRYVPGDTFEAAEFELRYCMDQVERVKPKAEPVEVQEEPAHEAGFTMKHKGRGRYNVYDSQGNIVNDEYLTRSEAEDLCQ